MFTDLTLFIKNHTSINLNFHKQILLENYQEDWINLFSKVIFNPLEDELIYKPNQHFVIPVTLSNRSILDIQIDIDKILYELPRFNLPKINIPTSRFIRNTPSNREQLYNNPHLIGYDIDYSFDIVNDSPIIVCRSDRLCHFVIDGNHRVDYSIRHGKSSVSAYILSSELLIATPHLFSDRLGYLLFCFLEDIALLHIALYEKQSRGLFGILRTEASLLRKQSILPIVQKYIDDTSRQN